MNFAVDLDRKRLPYMIQLVIHLKLLNNPLVSFTTYLQLIPVYLYFIEIDVVR
ncbi:hypothetical protein GCM10009117_20770 [Gangjinia marincola]|uniref:Uncharacterized protein n=1 Tax=Gangjinia marincola TaxID=578463 RepID=A0ABP3XU60_9FLAO